MQSNRRESGKPYKAHPKPKKRLTPEEVQSNINDHFYLVFGFTAPKASGTSSNLGYSVTRVKTDDNGFRQRNR